MMEAITLFELNNIVKETLKDNLSAPFWIQAELSEVHTNSIGHCYVEFVQKDERKNTLLAKARGNIWRQTFSIMKPYFEKATGQPFQAGIKVMVKVYVEFHELYGFSLNIVDIDPTYTIGDMERRRREILAQLEEEGVLTLNKELDMPLLPQRVAVISSATAAGYGDFSNQLAHNPFGFTFYPKLFPAVMQGEQVEQSIIQALDRINAELDQWDVVVIIRGGGATSDLNGFDTYDLAVNCAQFPLPIITGIGHERDDTVLDFISHTRVKTPTAAAEFLINQVRSTAEALEGYAGEITDVVTRKIQEEQNRLARLTERIPYQIRMRLDKEQYRQEQLIQRLSSVLQFRLQGERHRLDLMQQKMEAASPDHLLKKGYSITLLHGKAVTDADSLKQGDELETRFLHGTVKSVVISKEK